MKYKLCLLSSAVFSLFTANHISCQEIFNPVAKYYATAQGTLYPYPSKLEFNKQQLGSKPASENMQTTVYKALRTMGYTDYNQVQVFTLKQNNIFNLLGGLSNDTGIWLSPERNLIPDYKNASHKEKEKLKHCAQYICYHEAAHIAHNHHNQAKTHYEKEYEADQLAVQALACNKHYATIATIITQFIQTTWSLHRIIERVLTCNYKGFDYPSASKKSAYMKKIIAELPAQEPAAQKSWFTAGLNAAKSDFTCIGLSFCASVLFPVKLCYGLSIATTVASTASIANILHLYYMLRSKNMLPTTVLNV
ncbi:hypothetical protein KG892_04000 [Vermiphilus pyriformis]|nr:MAG: hypothetical protein KG892_04000 [Vermiphilus pyriformis]